MNSVFKMSLFAAALAFAVPNVAMAATATPAPAAPAKHKPAAHKYYKGHRYSKKTPTVVQGDQETADLNARSLQLVQSVNTGSAAPAATQQVVPNPSNQLPPSARVPLTGNQTTQTLNRDSLQDVNKVDQHGRVVIAPGTGNTVAAPAAPGAVNPNNMPPAQ